MLVGDLLVMSNTDDSVFMDVKEQMYSIEVGETEEGNWVKSNYAESSETSVLQRTTLFLPVCLAW